MNYNLNFKNIKRINKANNNLKQNLNLKNFRIKSQI